MFFIFSTTPVLIFSTDVVFILSIWLQGKSFIRGIINTLYVKAMTRYNVNYDMKRKLYEAYLRHSILSWIYRDKHGTFCLFCKMVKNRTILVAISLSNRSFPYEFNASIDCWLKTTSHHDAIAPSNVSTIQNAKLLTSRNLCHSMMLCNVTRSQHMGECETLRRPNRIK